MTFKNTIDIVDFEVNNMKKKKVIKHAKLKKSIVNIITLTRLLGAVLMIPIYISYGGYVAGKVALFVFLTDCVDGTLARIFHVQSFFGSILDAICDKTLGIVCLALIASYNPVFFGILVLEIGILVVNSISVSKGNNLQSSLTGKIKTVLLFSSIVLSFFCMELGKVEELIGNGDFFILKHIYESRPIALTNTMAMLVLGIDLFCFVDYLYRAKLQSKAFKDEENVTLEEINNTINELEKRRERLINKNSVDKTFKNKDEIMRDLFDTEYYLKHKDDGVRKLIFK